VGVPFKESNVYFQELPRKLGERRPSPFPLPKKGEGKKLWMVTQSALLLSDSLALWERVRACPGLDPGVRAIFIVCGRA
jgi:hypothetical protein